MSQPRRRKWIVLALAASVVLLSIGLYGRFLGRKRLRFPYLGTALPAAQYQALAAQPGWSASNISVAPRIRLNGLVRRPTAPDAPWVLFYQGNDRTQLEVGQAFLQRIGAGRDWGLAVFSYRGYDSSDGTPFLPDLAADAPQILEQLCATEKVDRGHVHLVGFSIGGHFAVRAMVAAAKLQPRPPSLTLLASVNDIVMFRRSFYDKLDPGDDFQTGPLLDAVPAPVLVVQGTADEALMGPQQGRDIAQKLGTRAEYLELAGVGHSALLSDSNVIVAVQEFIASHSN